MYIVLLKLGRNKSAAKEYMQEHKEWIQKGIDEGVFALVGSITPALGGAIIASHTNQAALEARIAQDPFVEHKIVDAEILPISVNHYDSSLSSLVME